MILCPYVKLASETKKALKSFAPDAEFVYTGRDDHAYWQALKERWRGKEDLIIIEQDIVITRSTISELASCPRAWCTFAYLLTASFKNDDGSYSSLETLCPHALGCVKISAEAQRHVAYVPRTRWYELDVAIKYALMTIGRDSIGLKDMWSPHCHGTIEHLHKDEANEVSN